MILSGDDDYTGGTTVAAGTLCVTNSDALARGTSLTVGNGGKFTFDSSVADAPMDATLSSEASPKAVVVAIPEPGTLALLVAWLLMVLGLRQRKKRIRLDFA